MRQIPIQYRNSKFVYPFKAAFNQLYDTLRRPFAINTGNNLFSDIKDYHSFYSFDKWSGIKLNDFVTAALCSSRSIKLNPVHFIDDWVTTEKELNEVKNILPEDDAREIKNDQRFIHYINPNVDMNGVRKFHALKKFW